MTKKIKWADVGAIMRLRDKMGEIPAVVILASRVRGAGKTYGVVKWLFNRFFKHGEKFILLTRQKGDTGGVAEGICKSVLMDLYPDWYINETTQLKGKYSEIYLTRGDGEDKEEVHVGYVIPLASASDIKRNSSKFIDADYLFFDEFLPEDYREYLPMEFEKLNLIMGSVMRGKGVASRFVRLILSGNTVTMYNPYFEAFNLIGSIQKDTKLYRGDGVVLKVVENPDLVEAHKATAWARATATVGGNDYTGDTWFKDYEESIVPPTGWGEGRTLFVIYYNEKPFYVRYYSDIYGFLYVDTKGGCREDTPKYRWDNNSNLDLPILKGTSHEGVLKRNMLKGNVRFRNVDARRLIFGI